jgi:hypothetical protein
MIYVSVGVLDCVVDKLDDPLTLLVALIVILPDGDPVVDLETLIVLDIVPLPVDVLDDVEVTVCVELVVPVLDVVTDPVDVTDTLLDLLDVPDLVLVRVVLTVLVDDPETLGDLVDVKEAEILLVKDNLALEVCDLDSLLVIDIVAELVELLLFVLEAV